MSCLEKPGEDDEELVFCQGLADAVTLAFRGSFTTAVLFARIYIMRSIFVLKIK